MKKLVFIVVILFLSGCYLNGMVTELKPISNIDNSSLNKDTYIHLSIYCKYSNHPVELKFWYATYDYKNFSNVKYNNCEFKRLINLSMFLCFLSKISTILFCSNNVGGR